MKSSTAEGSLKSCGHHTDTLHC